MNIVAHNLTAMFSNRYMGITNKVLAKSSEKLASGYKINRAADDAAGLAISEKMRRQIKGLTQASKNVQDGISLAQTADGYLHEVHDMLQRMNELSVKGANGTLTAEDRGYIDEEVQALKDEMSRIFHTANFNEIPLFHVPYTPEIVGTPNDMQVFHSGDGKTGGLEFNNVRYNISELKNLGLKIDDNGVATEDFEKKFTLWDGESVDLSLKEGQSLDKVVRNYKWTADETGIYINDKLSAEWSEVSYNGKVGVDPSGKFAVGNYSFSHHGMNISFVVDEEADLEQIMDGINGDAATDPATWDVSVGGLKASQSADIDDDTSSQTIRVTSANKDVIDYNYSIVADENGIAIKSVNKKDASDTNQTAYVAWNTFKDSALASLTDENGNAVETNGGYPILNWGDENDANSQSEITFDAGATYHFTSPDPNVKIEFDFSLAESSSFDEVVAALNGAAVEAANVSAPGALSGSTATSVGNISVGTSKALATSFDLQRAYGRDFDNDSATLTANITVERNTISGQPSESDTTLDDGYYASGSGHTVTRGAVTTTVTSVNSMPDTSADFYEYYAETVDVKDENGNPVYETDEDGNSIKKTETKYYRFWDERRVTKYTESWDATDTWTQQVKYTFDGSLNGHDMSDATRNQRETYSRTLKQSQNKIKSDIYRMKKEITAEEYNALPSNARILSESQFNNANEYANNNGGYMRTTYYPNDYSDIFTNEIGEATLTSISTGSFNNIAFKTSEDNVTGSDTAFSFNYSLSLTQARVLAKTTGAQSAGAVNFKASDYATRQFTPNENSKIIGEADFSNIKLNVPKKHLAIQAGAEALQHIDMEWSPLNLTILGISGANTRTQSSSEASIDMVKNALQVIAETRSAFGAYQNRFEHTIRNLDNVVENTQRAESEIRDTDMAEEMVRYSNNNIIAQAGQTMLAQANQSNQGILSLLS